MAPVQRSTSHGSVLKTEVNTTSETTGLVRAVCFEAFEVDSKAR